VPYGRYIKTSAL